MLSRTVLIQKVEISRISSLEQNIISSIVQEAMPCMHRTTADSVCQGKRLTSFDISDKHLLIELISSTTDASSDFLKDVIIPLDDLPTEMRLSNTVFRLRGIISFTGGSNTTDSIGHYVGVCRRSNGHWEIYNDLVDKKSSIQGNKRIPCQMLIYTI